MKYAIVLAAGKGTRMKTSLNNVMHEITGKPMIGHLNDRLEKLEVQSTHVVVGYQKVHIMNYLGNRVQYAIQSEQLGTGHAVQMVSDLKDKKGKTILLYGDVPLILPETMENLFEQADNSDMVILTAELDDPGMYGRIVRGKLGEVQKIVEYRDASESEKHLQEINTGIYCFDNELLFKYLGDLTNDNSQGEYYITDLVEMFAKNHHSIKTIRVSDIDEVMGINDRLQLAKASAWLQEHVNCHWMSEGVTLIDPKNTYISTDAQIGQDTIIYPNVMIRGKSVIGEDTIIHSGSVITNSVVGNHCVIESSKIIDSEVRNDVSVGPNAHIRAGSLVEDKNRIGNFVELKNTHIGFDSRCAHLSYLGDSTVGSHVNIGCGVVTVNYDGVNKHRTVIEDGAFIGSNVNLIAPITVGKNAVVAAGATITDDVQEGDLVIERAPRIDKAGYGIKYKNKEKIEKGKV
ncbi:MAG: bifunctional UDP-N-acetylglucosamine diphosphorylase/glucosamine-1-phosphate N-acetyltransferase GlmU [Erysipelothrix sp.]|nr:bifunctional UDP-N-acetylglucosamine diphosphorylase/glucosamine-1-phosphate N-acetyltransferase GlmU [Erysipelothrix sp.]